MKHLLTIFSLVLLLGCSSNQYSKDHYQSPLSREVANKEVDKLSALGRLQTVQEHIEATRESLPILGNPRYYLFENFEERVHSTLQELADSNDPSLNQKVFVPRNRDMAKKFLDVIAAYKVMSEAGIYINYSAITPEDPQPAAKNLSGLNRAMDLYYKDIEKIIFTQPGILKIEDKELAFSKERSALANYLLRRIESFYDQFTTKGSHKRNVQSFIGKVRSIPQRSVASINEGFSSVKKSRYFKRTSRYFKNLSLPESGSINGSEEAFERVLSVQFSFELLNFVIDRQLRQ